MGGQQWKRAWKRTDFDPQHVFFQITATKERAHQLAKLNLPKGTPYLVIRFGDQWAWVYKGDAEEYVT
jgi:hypothetical protein